MAKTILSKEQMLQRLQEEMRRPPFHALLGPQAYDADPASGEVVVQLPYQEAFSLSPTAAFYHGGVLASLVDMAAHAAIAVQTGKTVPTIDLRIDYLRPAPGVTLLAHARPLRVGRSIGRAEVKIYADQVLVVLGQGVFSTQ